MSRFVIPTEAARLFLPRRILARRVAQWRDLLYLPIRRASSHTRHSKRSRRSAGFAPRTLRRGEESLFAFLFSSLCVLGVSALSLLFLSSVPSVFFSL
jgi:hypothetical protein